MLGVYNNMAIGLVVTGIVAFAVSQLAVTTDASLAVEPSIRGLMLTPFGHAIYFSPIRWVVMFAPFAFVLFLSFKVQSLAPATARLLFFAFAALMGLSLSSILLIYTQTSVANAFFITAGDLRCAEPLRLHDQARSGAGWRVPDDGRRRDHLGQPRERFPRP